MQVPLSLLDRSAVRVHVRADSDVVSLLALAAIDPPLVRGAIAAFASRDVMRFLGKRPERRYCGEVVSDYGDRPEGVRVKHLAFGNALKVYDKGGSILRIETTINQPGAFRSYRASQREPDGEKSWRPMRKGIADLHRRAEVSQQCNNRYSDALASLDTPPPLSHPGSHGVPPGDQGRQAMPTLRLLRLRFILFSVPCVLARAPMRGIARNCSVAPEQREEAPVLPSQWL